MHSVSRRQFIAGSLAATSVAAIPPSRAGDVSDFPAPLKRNENIPVAEDEHYWQQIAAQFDVKTDIINVENGNWGIMSRPVMQAYFQHTRRVNRDNSYFSRREYGAQIRPLVQQVANRLAVDSQEIALTRGATEALQNLIANYRLLKANEAVIYSDLDYDAMQAAMDAKAASVGANVIKLKLPEPASKAAIINTYEAALRNNSNARLLLLTHLSHRTGLVLPVADITRLARQYGVDVIVDAAHSWGQLDFIDDDLGADFVGYNLHKWMGAPIGVGIMYIRENRLQDIAPNMSASPAQQDSIWGRVHSGTSNFAAFLTIDEVFRFHDWIGASAKAQRLTYLRQCWVNEVIEDNRITLLTPEDSALYGGITSFRIKGQHTSQANQAIAAYMLDRHKVFTVHRNGVANGSCVRITPSYYNSAEDMRLAARAVKGAIREFSA